LDNDAATLIYEGAFAAAPPAKSFLLAHNEALRFYPALSGGGCDDGFDTIQIQVQLRSASHGNVIRRSELNKPDHFSPSHS